MGTVATIMVESVQEYLDNTPDKPYLMCEYCHCMGNGPGDLEDYFQMIQSHSGLVGGFLWEWCDHGIYKGKAQDGRSIFYYGGDHGEWPHDGNFCMDGLVFPDRRPHTGLLEFKNVYRPARVVSYDQSSGALTLHNYMDFTELTEYVALRYEVSCDGEILISGNVNYPDGFRLDPHTDNTLPLRVNIPEKGRCFLKIFYHCKQDSEILKEGYLLGFDELPLENRCCRNQNAEKLWELSASAGELHVRETDRALILSCEQFTYVFSKLTGLFDKMTFGNEPLLSHPVYAGRRWLHPVRAGFSQPANHRPHDGCRSTGDERETPQSPAAVQIPSRPHQTGTNRGASHRVPAAHPGGIKKINREPAFQRQVPGQFFKTVLGSFWGQNQQILRILS